MDHEWMIRARTYGNCNCGYGCPCQFQAPSTHGNCTGISSGIVDEGHFDGVDLSGLRWVYLLRFPGEVADGNGTCQTLIDASGSPEQREGLRSIVCGEHAAPGSNFFAIINSLMTDVKETLYVPMSVDIDIDARQGKVHVEGLVESTGTPIPNPFTESGHGVSITIDEGMEYETANIGRGSTKVTAGLDITLDDSYGQFAIYHWNQDGLIRSAKAA